MSTSYRLPLPEHRPGDAADLKLGSPSSTPSSSTSSSSSSSTGSSSSSTKSSSGIGSTMKGGRRFDRSIRYDHLLGGMMGGGVSTLILHPLDLLKIRFAVDDGKGNKPHYAGLRQAVTTIFRSEGMRGLYRGVTPNVAGAGSAWGFYFLFYQTIKDNMQSGDSAIQLTPARHMLAAAEAGVLTLVVTNPIGVVKTRLCLQYGNGGASVASATNYKGMSDAFLKITKHEGIRGLYAGFVPGMVGVSHGALQFMAYEELKCSYNKYNNMPIDTRLGSSEYLLFAAISKFFAAVTTYPYQVVRARLQETECRYNGVLDCIRKTFKYEGIIGFYKGMCPYLVHVMPNICLVFLIYEKVTSYR